MLKQWAGRSNDLLRDRNGSNCGNLLVCCVRYVLRGPEVLATLPHLPTVVVHGHYVRYPVLHLDYHFQVVFYLSRIKYWVIPRYNTVIGLSKHPENNFFTKCLAWGCWLAPANNISPNEKITSTPIACHIIENMSHAMSMKLAYFECISSCSCHQAVMSAFLNVMQISIWSVR